METLYLKGEKLKEVSEYDFPALKKALNREKQATIEILKESGLKGRGGAGFPTGFKWDLASGQETEKKFMICNGDEGEPGTFKDRYLMEERPLKVLEGILLGAYVIGAEEGFIYIRGEYADAIDIFSTLIADAYHCGMLGENIMGSDFSFELELVKGAGAYVCGDETSLLNSIEGKRGRSRIKPPYPVKEGLFGYPTVVNNVETLASAAEIIKSGVDEYTRLGTEESRGTKLVCLSGDVNQPGVYEVEFGSMTLREIIEELGKGIKEGRELKLLIPGGISTAALAADELDIPYTYEDLEEAGTGVGSGAMIAISGEQNLRDLMLNVSRFFMDETCGTCFPCREGNRQINRILSESEGGFSEQDRELVFEVGDTIALAARCGLGQSSLNFIESVFARFQDELSGRRK